MVDPLRNLAPLAIGFLVAGIAASFGQGAWAAEIQIESPSFEFDPERNAYKYNGARIQIEDLCSRRTR